MDTRQQPPMDRAGHSIEHTFFTAESITTAFCQVALGAVLGIGLRVSDGTKKLLKMGLDAETHTTLAGL